MSDSKRPLLFIIATHSKESRGGISSSVEAFENSLTKIGKRFVRINSHNEQRNNLKTWIQAGQKLIRETRKHPEQRCIYWFHCGPWFSMFRKFVLAILSKSLGGENVAHFHSYTLADYLSSRTGRILLRVFLLPFDKVVALTPWWQEQLKTVIGKRPSSIIPNPISFSLLEYAQKHIKRNVIPKKLSAEVQIFTMTRLTHGKGVEYVIQAMALLPPNYYLTVAGDGPIKKTLEAKVNLLGITERVSFVGWLDVKEKEQKLCNSDIFCLPSYDSFGMVFIEAMSVGLPIVALNSGPIADVVTANEGILVNDTAPESIATALQDITNNYRRYQSSGPRRVASEYDPVRLAELAITFFDQA